MYEASLAAMAVLSVLVFAILLRISAPYGRHTRRGWGPVVNNRLGWLIMEAPAALVLPGVIAVVNGPGILWLFVLLWECHYAYRAFIYPFTLPRDKSMPVLVMLMGVAFNSANGALIGMGLVRAAGQYDGAYFVGMPFVIGLVLFAGGLLVTRHADAILRRLAAEGRGYQVPEGGLYRWVSCPNYLAESVQWGGWALLTFSPAGAVFFLWTLANLLPRALTHHRWYRATFPDYPASRRAFLPLLL